MKATRADIEHGLRIMAKYPMMRSCLPEANQLERFIAKLEENRPGILQWKKYHWIGGLLSDHKLSRGDAEHAVGRGYLGQWGNREFNAPLNEKEFEFMVNGLYETIEQLAFVKTENDSDKLYLLRRGLSNAFTYVAVAQLERELGVPAQADNPRLQQ